jgi:hypothetical protein
VAGAALNPKQFLKNTLIILFATTTLALSVVCVVQWQKRDAQRAQIASLRGEVDQKTREIGDLQAAQMLLAKQRHESLEQAGDLATKLQAQRAATAKATAKAVAASEAAKALKSGKGKGGLGEFFSKMMDDPETRKVIRQQQRMMMDQLYAPFIKQMGFTPEEAAQFKDLLLDNIMKGAEKASSLFGGDSATNRTEMLNTLAVEQKSFDEQLKQFLGDTRYAQYKDYQETVSERMQLNQFQMQSGGENALTEQQTEQLLMLMRQEKQAVAKETGQTFPGAGQSDAAKFEAMLSGDSVEKLLQAQETVNQRVYERAKDLLTESQLSSFARFQTNQLQTMRMGITMARKFMLPENPASEAQSPNP